jgi:cobalt-zinc-cadmium efflux system protein
MLDGHPGDAFLADATKMLREEFHIGHATLQLEMGDDVPCGLHSECTAEDLVDTHSA